VQVPKAIVGASYSSHKVVKRLFSTKSSASRTICVGRVRKGANVGGRGEGREGGGRERARGREGEGKREWEREHDEKALCTQGGRQERVCKDSTDCILRTCMPTRAREMGGVKVRDGGGGRWGCVCVCVCV